MRKQDAAACVFFLQQMVFAEGIHSLRLLRAFLFSGCEMLRFLRNRNEFHIDDQLAALIGQPAQCRLQRLVMLTIRKPGTCRSFTFRKAKSLI